MNGMSVAQMWALVIGMVLPPVVAFVQRDRFSSPVKVAIMLATAVVDGLGSAYFTGQFHGTTVVTAVLVAAVAIGTAYQSIWKPLGVTTRITSALSRPSAPAKPGV